jgi:hypothetical protein
MSLSGITQVVKWVRSKSWAEAYIACNRSHDGDSESEDVRKFWCFRVADYMYEVIKHKLYRPMYTQLYRQQSRKEVLLRRRDRSYPSDLIQDPGLYYIVVDVIYGSAEDNVDEHALCIYIVDKDNIFVFQGLGGHGPGVDFATECVVNQNQLDLSLIEGKCPHHESCYGCWVVNTNIETIHGLMSGNTLPVSDYDALGFDAYVKKYMNNAETIRLDILELRCIHH